ncbi:uncharacterized protein MELLADRAFT_85302 [Melampsora larici-populina 98AG31]|uniref:Uncharacterized protein n=1 Tax=Melampsora larici-populina (strain 98AG31 / pathotype 3-4-7) TaxID=747676 RepID=F4RIA2_MELLP|nr:uncharacterized protein MELLADRAFT_85302 [Melampsora larici-populina 98AG31]EGG08003.1 hypothetical protein MELLADRAFT_85302 [Melampsora larici-populina 98AG31]
MPFNLPANFATNPEAFLRKPRPSQLVDSPPAPAPPRYNWPIEGEDVNTPNRTLRTIYPSSSHTLVTSTEPEPTLTPDTHIVRNFFDRANLSTPLVPGSFIFTPMAQPPTGSLPRIGEIPNTEAMSRDEIIETLQEKVERLEHEKQEWKTKLEVAAADRARIDALELTISRLLTGKSPETARSTGSNNPFAAFRNQLTTPTPAGPREQRTVNTEIAQALTQSSPVLAQQDSPIRQAFIRPTDSVQRESRRVSFTQLVDPELERQASR